MNIQHIFFDLDHTLWDFEKNSELALQKVFKKQNITIDLTSFLQVYKPINLEFWRLFRNEQVTKSELRYGRLKKTFDALGYAISDNLIHTIANEYIEFLPHFNYLFDGTFEILEYLKAKYKLHIITNGFEKVQLEKLKNSKILDYFNVVVTSESVGVKKPNPKVFNYALGLANAKKEQSIMIGDSVEADVLGALNVGMQAIHCNFDCNEIDIKNFTSVTNLLELKQYL